MPRDIEYAAIAVHRALTEKYGRQNDLHSVQVTAGETTISIRDGSRAGEGSRDDLLAAIRAADTYEQLWKTLGKD
jgi:hypothetical protein